MRKWSTPQATMTSKGPPRSASLSPHLCSLTITDPDASTGTAVQQALQPVGSIMTRVSLWASINHLYGFVTHSSDSCRLWFICKKAKCTSAAADVSLSYSVYKCKQSEARNARQKWSAAFVPSKPVENVPAIPFALQLSASSGRFGKRSVNTTSAPSLANTMPASSQLCSSRHFALVHDIPPWSNVCLW